MFQNKIKTKLKPNKVNKKADNKKTLKLHKIEEINKQKIEIMQEKMNVIHEKLSSFKGSIITKNKNISRNNGKIERKLSINEIKDKSIKRNNLLSVINISPNFQQKNVAKLPLKSTTNNFYNKNKLHQSKVKSSKEKFFDSKHCFSNDKDYFIKKKKENNNALKKKSNIVNSKVYDSTNREKNSNIKIKGNYSIDKENISFEKNTNFNSIEIYDRCISNNKKKELIQPYKKSHEKTRNKKENTTKEFFLLNEIKPNKSISLSEQKAKDEINICLDSNQDISSINKSIGLDQLGAKNIANLSKETPSTKNTLKNEIKISENLASNKYNKINNNENDKNNNLNKKDLLNNKNENPKIIRIMKCISKRNIIHKNIKRNNNRSFEYNHKYNLNLSRLRNINTNTKIQDTKELKKNNNISSFTEKNLLSITSPKFNRKNNITTKITRKNNSKNLITLRKATLNCKIEVPYEHLNPKRNHKINYYINNKLNNKMIKSKKHSSFNLSKSKLNKFEEKPKNMKNQKKDLKVDKQSKKFHNKSCENLNVFNFKTIQNNIKELEEKPEKRIPHVFSVILKRKGLNQKEYPNMALRMNSSQGNISKRKSFSPIYKEMKLIKEIEYICKKGFSGPGIKKTNQDNFFIYKNFLNNNNYSYIGVCDGHGIFGQDISSYLVNHLPQNLSNDLVNQDLKNIYSERFEKISKYIESSFIQTNYELNNDERIDSTYSGSTCSSIIYTPKKLISINVGDSRCIIGKYNNEKWYPKILTIDHKPNLLEEKERIISSGGKVEPYKDTFGNFAGPDRVWKKEEDVPGLAMSRSFGDEIGHEVGVIVNPDIQEYEFVNEDKFIVLASDGIWEFISNDEVIDIVKNFYWNNDIRGAIDFLYKEASKRWIMEEEIIDDITVILVFLN